MSAAPAPRRRTPARPAPSPRPAAPRGRGAAPRPALRAVEPPPARRKAPRGRPAPTRPAPARPAVASRRSGLPQRLALAALRLATLPLRLVLLGVARLTGGRPWLALILLLGCGVIALHAKTLQINRTVAEREGRVARLERSTSSLRADVQRLRSTDRITRAGRAAGMVTPDPDGIGYLSARAADPARAAAAIAAPSADWTPTTGPSEQNGDEVDDPIAPPEEPTAPATIAAPQATSPSGAGTASSGSSASSGTGSSTSSGAGGTASSGAGGTGAGQADGQATPGQ